MQAEMGLTRESVIADAGSGTGFLAELFLDAGNVVFGVEPNREMREAAEALLAGRPNFHSVDGCAEATTLPARGVDFVTAGQAFHWFDPQAVRREFARILRPGGGCVFVWNWRRADATPFITAYEAFLERFCDEYRQLKKLEAIETDLATFFEPAGYEKRTFENVQLFDFDGLKGRLLSTSYAPLPGCPSHDAMIAELRRLFDAHQSHDRVRIDYDTLVYYGRLA
ncbi:MAG: class I SAM-dependent methyltransferase [Phycisphaerae bacterium]|nr:class I SAM-dependent methyltransferase [Phycisphaerae bacterium]